MIQPTTAKAICHHQNPNIQILSPGYPSTDKAQEKNVKTSCMEMIETLKKEMNKSLKEIKKNKTK